MGNRLKSYQKYHLPVPFRLKVVLKAFSTRCVDFSIIRSVPEGRKTAVAYFCCRDSDLRPEYPDLRFGNSVGYAICRGPLGIGNQRLERFELLTSCVKGEREL
jgi:hypothetical protein